MSSINDYITLVQMIAVCHTSEDIDSIEDLDIRQEVREEDMQGIRDAFDRVINRARVLQADRAYDYIDFSGGAIREHYVEGADDEAAIAGLSDLDLEEAGEWALNDENLWDSVYSAWDASIISVRSEKQKMVHSNNDEEKEETA